MALSDILERIERDGRGEADAILAAAEEQARTIVEEARARAENASASVLRAAELEARREDGTILANARLQARDRVLREKRELIDRAMVEAKAALLGLPDETYVALFAPRAAAASRGGERLLIAAADRARLAPLLPAALASYGAQGVELADEAAQCANGVILLGERMSVDLSVDSLVDSFAEEMSGEIAAVLFGEGEA